MALHASDADVESTALHHHSESLVNAFQLIDKVKLSQSLGEKGIIHPLGVLASYHLKKGHTWCNKHLLQTIENGVKANPKQFNSLLAELKRQAQVEQAQLAVDRDGKVYMKEDARLMKVTRELELTYRILGGAGAVGGSVGVVPPGQLQPQLLSGQTSSPIHVGRLDQKPTMTELISLQGRTQHIKIVKGIGVEWTMVGTILLDDKDGTTIPAIAQQYGNNTDLINMEILRRWMGGQGIPDRTWRGLLGVLRVHCLSLAESVEEALTPE